MTPYEQNVRMADAATPPAQTAPASGTAPVEGVPAIPEDAGASDAFVGQLPPIPDSDVVSFP